MTRWFLFRLKMLVDKRIPLPYTIKMAFGRKLNLLVKNVLMAARSVRVLIGYIYKGMNVGSCKVIQDSPSWVNPIGGGGHIIIVRIIPYAPIPTPHAEVQMSVRMRGSITGFLSTMNIGANRKMNRICAQ